MPKRLRRRRVLQRLLTWLALSVAAAAVLVVIVWPVLQSQWVIADDSEPVDATRLEAAQQSLQRAMQCFVLLWVFALGASFASFINVVAYRLPRGRSILGSSRCPRCQVRLSFRENLPVLGWLVVGGRCKRCRLPISPRYVVVELLLGGVFVLLLLVELVSGGVNLPNQPSGIRSGFVEVLFAPNWRLLGTYAYHVTLMTLLLALCLIRSERLRLPVRLTAFGFAIGFLVPLIDARVYPVMVFEAVELPSRVLAILTGAGGLLAGCLAGFFSTSLCVHSTGGPGQRADAAKTGGLIGLFLGWQASLSVLAISVALSWMAPLFCRPREYSKVPVEVWLSVSALMQICLWRFLDDLAFWPSQQPTLIGLTGPAVVVACAFSLKRLTGHGRL